MNNNSRGKVKTLIIMAIIGGILAYLKKKQNLDVKEKKRKENSLSEEKAESIR